MSFFKSRLSGFGVSVVCVAVGQVASQERFWPNRRHVAGDGLRGGDEAQEDGELGSPGEQPEHEAPASTHDLGGDVDDSVDEGATAPS